MSEQRNHTRTLIPIVGVVLGTVMVWSSTTSEAAPACWVVPL